MHGNCVDDTIKYWMAVGDGDEMWASSTSFNGLLRINKTNNKAVVERVFDDIPYNATDSFYAVIRAGDHIVFLPGAADYLALFSIKDKEIRKIKVPQIEKKYKVRYDESDKFAFGFTVNNVVYIFGWKYPAILKLDLSSYEMVKLCDWIDCLEEYISEDVDHGFFASGYAMENGIITLALSCCNAIVRLHVDNDLVEVYQPDLYLDGYECFLLNDNRYFGIARSGGKYCLFEYDRNSKIFREEDFKYSSDTMISGMFMKPIIYNNNIYLFTKIGLAFYKIRVDDFRIDKIAFKKDDNPCMIFGLYEDGCKVYFGYNPENIWHIYNMKTDEMSEFKVLLEDKDYRIWFVGEQIREQIQNTTIISENDYSLDAFLSHVSYNNVQR